MRKIVKCIRQIAELNVDLFNGLGLGVEIQDFTEPNLSEEDKKDIIDNYIEVFKGFKGIKSMHGPFLDLKPSSPDLLIREISYKRYLDTINIARELDMDYLIYHSQINPYLNEPGLSKLNNLQAKEFWDKILDETDFKGIILIENVFEEGPEMLRDYIDMVSRPNIRINLDIGHAKLGKASLETWIQTLRDYIAYVHIHSNNDLYDQHVMPSPEEIAALFELLDKYRINPVLSLEYKIVDIEKEIIKYF